MSTDANINIPIETLLAMLRAEGIRDIGVTAILDIQKILATLDENEIRDYRKLKYYIRPIVCRNKEDQEKFNHVFEKYIQWIDSEKLNVSRVPEKKKRTWWWIAVAIIPCMALPLLLKQRFITKQPYLSLSQETVWPTGKYQETAIGDSVSYTVYLNDTTENDQYSIEWTVGKNNFGDLRTVDTVYRDTGIHIVKVFALNKQTGVVLTNSLYTTVKCDHSPVLRIRRESLNGKTKYSPVPGDTTAKAAHYAYKWFINDSLVSTDRELISNGISKKANTIKLLADTRGLYCSTDSLIALYNENPAYQFAAKASQPTTTSSSFLVWNALALLGLLLLFPAAIAFYIYKRWKIQELQPPASITPITGNTTDHNDRSSGPFSIQFKNQDHKIEPGEQVNRLADGLRKRQLSDTLQLNLKQTIGKTIKAGGFPTFQFSPKTKPVDFLILIDKEYPDSHMVKLFEFVVERLRTEQVNIIVYDYYKEPLFLNNKRFNHVRLPLEKLIQLYPDTILIVFSHAHYLLETLHPKLKPWAEEKLKQWETQVIITPVPKKDWSYKEAILQQSGFIVIPADLYQNNVLKILLDVISLQVETTKQDKMEMPDSYSARYYNFQDFDALAKYLADDQLLEWISATAVYPHVDWNVTLAVGKALENADRQNKLITYEHLLKISRISWMQDAVIDDELRLDMLRHISNTTEATARKAIVELLEEIKGSFKENSFAKEEYDLHRYGNLFMLHAGDASNTMPDETLVKVTEYIKKGYFDWPQTIYHEEASDTLIKHPGSTISIPINSYLDILARDREEKEKQLNEEQLQREKEAAAKRRRIKMLRNLTVSFLPVLLSLSAAWLLNNYDRFHLWKTTKQALQVTLHNAALLSSFGEISLSIQADSTYIGKKVNDSVYTFPGIIQGRSDQPVVLSINQNNSPALTAAISIDSSYDAYIMEPVVTEKQLLSIFYNNKTYYNAVQQQLTTALSMYDIEESQRNFKDSSRIVYYNNQKAAADSIASIIKRSLGINIVVIAGTSNSTTPVIPELYLNVEPAEIYTCNAISVDALPVSLNDIWRGAGNNRFIRIDFKSGLIYYSTKEKTTYGTYVIDEICLDASGTYRITTRANNQYRVFFIKNIKDGSLSLSMCQTLYNNKTEITTVSAGSCGNFSNMTLYFADTSPNSVSANISNHFNFSTTQRDKLDNIFSGVSATDTINLEANINTTAPGMPADQRFTLLTNDFPKGPTRAINTIGYNIIDNIIQWNRKDYRGTPFDRDFAVIQIKKAQGISNPCDRTYYSMREALNVTDASQICRLNLEKEQLTTLPAQLFTFRNMQELTLGVTTISESEIKRLQSALPKCRITYSAIPAGKPEEMMVGQLTLDRKYNPDKESIFTIANIARQLRANTSSQIKLRVNIESASEEKMMMNVLQDLTKRFYKEGVRSDLKQITNDIIFSQNNQSQEQQPVKKAPSSPTYVIDIIGINWKEAGSKSAY